MKIGFMRFNNPVELDYSRASINTKGTDRRLGILEALVMQGFEVEIYSYVSSKPSKQSLLSMYGNFNQIDYSFLDKITIKDYAKKPDCDVMFIENGPTNTTFRYSDKCNLYPNLIDGVSFIYRTFDMLDKYEGLVVYFQHDSSLFFPFGRNTRTPSPSGSQISFGTMTAKFDILKNKHYKLVTTANTEKMMQKFSILKDSSYQHMESWQHIPICYSKNIDRPKIPKENPFWNLVYVGTQDNFRAKQLETLLHNIEKGAIIGDWITKICQIQMLGKRGKHSDVYSYYNNAYVGLQLPNKLDLELDNMTSRLVQIICGGSIVLASNYTSEVVSEYKLENFIVNSAEDLCKKVDEISNMTLDERKSINTEQLNNLKQWSEISWKQILEN